MSQDPNNNLIIDTVGSGEGDDLLGCYFVYNASNHTYSFFEKNSDTPLLTDLHRGQHFSFKLKHHPKLEWRLSISKKSTSTLVKGKYKDKHQNADPDEWEPEQSYQAQGGGQEEGETNAAAATA